MAEKSVILATAGYDHTVRFWQAPTGVCQRTLQHADSQVNALEITPDKQYLAVAGNPSVSLFECHTNNANPVTTFAGHTSNVTSVGFPKNAKWMFTGSEDGSVKIWDLRAPGYQRDYRGKSPISTVALHPNQGELICGDEDGNIRIWDLSANMCSSELIPDGNTPIRSLSIASDASTLVAASNRGTCFVWKMSSAKNVPSLELTHKIDAHSSYILKCLLSPDSKVLATASADETIKLWNVDNGFSLDKTLLGHTSWVWDCAFSADSAYLVSASSDRTSKLWDIKNGDVIIDYKGHGKVLTSVALNDS